MAPHHPDGDVPRGGGSVGSRGDFPAVPFAGPPGVARGEELLRRPQQDGHE